MDDAKLRERATERVRVKREFLSHFVLYATVNAALFLIWAITSRGYPWFVWPLFGWGIGIVGHAISVVMKLRELGPEDDAVERELRRLRARAKA